MSASAVWTAEDMERGRRGLAACHQVLNRTFDPFAATWDGLAQRERSFWCRLANVPVKYHAEPWLHIPGNFRDTIKNNLYRAAKRAAQLLPEGAQ